MEGREALPAHALRIQDFKDQVKKVVFALSLQIDTGSFILFIQNLK